MKHLFINPKNSLIRAGWRIVIFFCLFLILNITLSFVTRQLIGSLKGGGTLWFLVLGISATIAAFISTKYIDKQSLVSLGLKMNGLAFLDVLAGIGISGLIMTAMFFSLEYLGYIQFEGYSWWSTESDSMTEFNTVSLLTMLGVFFRFIVVAWWEEIAFRGILLQNISKGLGLKWGVILSTICFGLIHAGNPDATILSTLLIIVITSKLIYAYLKTGQLWLAIGLHLGWNFFQASIYGFSSSGHSSPALIKQSPIGQEWLSGGAFGAENSILIVPYTFLSLIIIHIWVKRTRQSQKTKFFEFLVKKSDF